MQTPGTARNYVSRAAKVLLGLFAGSESELETYRRHHYRLQFSVDKWAKALGQHTFRSELLRITFREAEALLWLHRKHSDSEKKKEKL